MDRFKDLRYAAYKQSEEGDFPSWLLADILDITGDPERYAGQSELVELLLTQVNNFDSYADAGCFSTCVGASTIEATIRQIMNNRYDEEPSAV